MEPIMRPRAAFNLLLGAGFVFSLSTCRPKETRKVTPNPSDTTFAQTALIMGNPVDYGEKNLLLFPVGGNYNPSVTEPQEIDAHGKTRINISSISYGFTKNSAALYDSYARDEYINTNENDFDIRNILFYDQITGASHPLAMQHLHILSFAIHKELKKPLIFYRIVKKDTNKDYKYNSEDAVLFCISDIDGKNLVETTPEDEQFIQYFYYSQPNTILIKTSIDTDKNGKYTMLDETGFREVKLNAPALGREIFSKAVRDSINNLCLEIKLPAQPSI